MKKKTTVAQIAESFVLFLELLDTAMDKEDHKIGLIFYLGEIEDS